MPEVILPFAGATPAMHYRARTYFPEIWRFGQSDPPLETLWNDAYEYARNKPTAHKDPTCTTIDDLDVHIYLVWHPLRKPEELRSTIKKEKDLSALQKVFEDDLGRGHDKQKTSERKWEKYYKKHKQHDDDMVSFYVAYRATASNGPIEVSMAASFRIDVEDNRTAKKTTLLNPEQGWVRGSGVIPYGEIIPESSATEPPKDKQELKNFGHKSGVLYMRPLAGVYGGGQQDTVATVSFTLQVTAQDLDLKPYTETWQGSRTFSWDSIMIDAKYQLLWTGLQQVSKKEED